MKRLVIDQTTYAMFVDWSHSMAVRSGELRMWNARDTAITRAFEGEDPATFTPGHPDNKEETKEKKQ